jgi:hypothetical protein
MHSNRSALLAGDLCRLARLCREAESLTPCNQALDVWLRLLRRHGELERAVAERLGLSASWCARVLAGLNNSLRDLTAARPLADTRIGAALAVESHQPRGDDAFGHRLDLLARGVGLGGRWADLYRVAVEVTASAGAALGAARQTDPPWRREAQRLARTGVVRARDQHVYVGPLAASALPLFAATPAMADACAAAGDLDALEDVHARLGGSVTARAARIAVALAVGGDAAAEQRLAALPSRERDRALVAIVEICVTNDRPATEAEPWACAIRSPALRARALGWVAHAFSRAGVIRRDRLPANAPRLEQALLRAELAAHRGPIAMSEALEDLGMLLRQERHRGERKQAPPALVALAPRLPTAWERALRCAVMHVADGWPLATLRFPSAVGRAALASPIVRRELERHLVAGSQGDRARERLHAAFPWGVAVMRAIEVARGVERCDPASRLRALPAADLARMSQPETPEAALVAGALLHGAARKRPTVDLSAAGARDSLRAAFDLGVALSPRAHERSRELLRACRLALLAEPDAATATAHDVSARRLRLACFSALTGASAAEAARDMLRERIPDTRVRLALFESYARGFLREATEQLWDRFVELTDDGRIAAAMLRVLSQVGTLSDAAAASWLRLETAAGPAAAAWWQAFAAAWRLRLRRPVSAALLRLAAAGLEAGSLPHDGAEAAGAVLARVERWLRRGLEVALERAVGDDLAWVLAAAEPDPDAAWPTERWRRMLGSLGSEVSSVDVGVVDTLARRAAAAAAPAFVRRLLAGAPPTRALAAPIALPGGLELRYLDKARDMLALLRIADCAPCCFSSDSPHFENEMRTMRWVYRLYRDPLSFGVHVFRAGDPRPCGFVFGSYALAEPAKPHAPATVALLLNGVYLRRQTDRARVAIVAALEEALARPLGIALVGIAAIHGGSGPLPERYQPGARNVTRLRALRDRCGQLETAIYDDISRVVNQPAALDLHWTELS